MRTVLRVVTCFFACAGYLTLSQAQQTSPQAASVVSQSHTALSNGVVVADVQLVGSARWIAGSTRTSGTVTLAWKGTEQSRIDLPPGATVTTELRNAGTGGSDGGLVRADGTLISVARHNCLTTAAWFSPQAIMSWFQRSDAVLSYVGTEMAGNVSVLHLRLRRKLEGKTVFATNLLQKLSVMDVYVDAKSYLPASLRFAEHPEDDATRSIAVEIRFSDYRNVNGIMIPFHIQRLRQNSLNFDITITSAVVNSGLPDSLFALQ
jgi:hypothetical protein